MLSGAAGGEDQETSSSAPDVPRSSKIGPAAQLLLQGAGLSAEDVTPSGPGGIVTKGDVMRAIAGAVATEPYTKFNDEHPPLHVKDLKRVLTPP